MAMHPDFTANIPDDVYFVHTIALNEVNVDIFEREYKELRKHETPYLLDDQEFQVKKLSMYKHNLRCNRILLRDAERAARKLRADYATRAKQCTDYWDTLCFDAPLAPGRNRISHVQLQSINEQFGSRSTYILGCITRLKAAVADRAFYVNLQISKLVDNNVSPRANFLSRRYIPRPTKRMKISEHGICEYLRVLREHHIRRQDSGANPILDRGGYHFEPIDLTDYV
jgi:hypothetical protein